MPKSRKPDIFFQHNIDSGVWNELTKAYKANPSIELYVKMRRENPKALIEVSTSYSMDWLLSNGERLEAFGVNPRVVAGCLDADPEDLNELSLLLMENLIQRRVLENDGVAHVQSRSEIIPDSLINYLICMMLDALDWNDELQITRDLIVLIKHQFAADISIEARNQDVRERQTYATFTAARLRAMGRKCSLRDIADLMKVSPTTVARWYKETSFEDEVARLSGLFDENGETEMDKFAKKHFKNRK